MSFDNDTARNVIIFGVDNSLLSHSDNHKNILLVLSEGPTFGITIMDAFVHQRKSLVLILVKKKQNFVWVYIIMLIIVVCY